MSRSVHETYLDIARAEDIELPVLRAVYAYWNTIRGDQPMPSRADIDPVDIPPLLRHIGLIEVLPDRPRVFRYRLVGSDMVRMFGRDMTGKTTDDVPHPDLRRMVTDAFEHCRAAARPIRQKWWHPWDTVVSYERVMLPLRGASGEVAMILLSAIETHAGAFVAAFDTDVARR